MLKDNDGILKGVKQLEVTVYRILVKVFRKDLSYKVMLEKKPE